MRHACWFFLLWFAACGGDDPSAGDDAGSDAGAASSSSGTVSSSSSSGASGSGGPRSSGGASSGQIPDAAPSDCAVDTVLGATEPVAGIAAGAHGPTFSADELRVVFTRDGENLSGSIYEAARPTIDAPFGEPVDLGLATRRAPLGSALLSDDGLHLTFTAADDQGGVFIDQVDRATVGSAFAAPFHVRTDAYGQLTARDGSVRLTTAITNETFGILAQRPAGADADETVVSLVSVGSWYEAASGTLWFAQAITDITAFTYWQRHWNGDEWEPAEPIEQPISWASVDRCRLYGSNAEGVVVRHRPPPAF